MTALKRVPVFLPSGVKSMFGGGGGGKIASIFSIAGPLPYSLSEGTGGGTTPFVFTVTRTILTDQAGSVDWQVIPGTGVTASDFAGGVIPSGTLNFSGGQASLTITVTVSADATVESNEPFQVALSNPRMSSGKAASLKVAAAKAIIVNDDVTVTITPPTKTGNPSISGSTSVGATLTATHGTYSGTVSGYNGQWYKGASAIAGQTGLTYVNRSGDVGSLITYRESAFNGGGSSATGTSNAIGPITISSGGSSPKLDFSVPGNSEYVALVAF
jgi:hypothetical protein